MQTYAKSLKGAPATTARTLSAIMSLLSYGQRVGYLPFNVGAAFKLPTRKNEFAARILSEEATHRMLALEPDPQK